MEAKQGKVATERVRYVTRRRWEWAEVWAEVRRFVHWEAEKGVVAGRGREGGAPGGGEEG